MKVFRSFEEAEQSGEIRRLAVGFFDGVHRGHQRVFDAVRGGASSSTDPSPSPFSVLTFWPHPQSILAPDRSPQLITGLEHKLRLFEKAGASSSLVIPFDREFAGVDAEDFLDGLARHFPFLQHVACGPNFHFGKNRGGNAGRLAHWASSRNIHASLPAMFANTGGVIVSSSQIRDLLARGDLSGASESLGRPYGVWGRVIRGNQVGRQLGFPTANLETSDAPLIPPGVYAGYGVWDDGSKKVCALNLGRRPTIESDRAELRWEAHFLDYSGDLYGQSIELQPTFKIRPEQAFDSLESLKRQIVQDVAEVRQKMAS
jgi:riboflavin kinase/FMN adenylyltransferase